MKLKNLLSGNLDIGPCAVGIGTFDGVHIGHQHLISQIIQFAHEKQLPSVIFTFDHSPRKFLTPRVFKGYLTTPHEKFQFLQATGVNYVVFRPFDESFSSLSHNDFIREIIVETLMAETVFVGFNFSFGAGRNGNPEILKHELQRHGRDCVVIPPVSINNEIVSSSIIRAAVEDGDFARANLFLGREACFSGKVVHGDHRGRKMGFPTANLKLEESQKVLPPNGVYACYADTTHGSHPAIVNIGFRPTFNRPNHLLEAHLLNFSQDLYHQIIRIRFVERIRDEIRFPDMQSLVAQIENDKKRCIEILEFSCSCKNATI